MDSKTKRSLLAYATRNAKQISKTSKEEGLYSARLLMGSCVTCVLRPFSLPKHIRENMNSDEYDEYHDLAHNFKDINQVGSAVQAVEEFVKKH